MRCIEHDIRVPALVLCLLSVGSVAYAQSGTATLSGVVLDESNAVVPDVAVTVMAKGTGFQREGKTRKEGQFTFPALQPGKYTVRATRQGFTPVEVPDLTLNVDDNVSIRLQLKVERVGEEVTVIAEPTRMNTSPAVGAVVDRQFVENLPLNGRSFQALLQLTPGVVHTRSSADPSGAGQFSVNGQRTTSNYFTVDGVSANTNVNSSFGVLPGSTVTGALPGLTTLGGTSALLSVDALQEFRIQTSTYAAEFGRTPGGQVSLVTRSGTNTFRGSVFEFFRDDALDATDWFTNNAGQVKPELMQHDFGGVLGGPIVRGRTFFFVSYEGVRLRQPRAQRVSVPTVESRRRAIPAFRPYLNALPLPNGPEQGDGHAEFRASYSDPSRSDSTSVRIDQQIGNRFGFFSRFSSAPSYSRQRVSSLSQTQTTNQNPIGITIGATGVISARIVHDTRINYSRNDAPYTMEPDDFGGAIPPPISIFQHGSNPTNAAYLFGTTTGAGWQWGVGTDYSQRQLNIVDSLTLTARSHEWKFGLDFRRINPRIGSGTVGYQRLLLTPDDLSAGRVTQYETQHLDPAPVAVAFDNISLYAQDNWRVNRKLTLTYGLRWEFVPPPHTTEGNDAITLENLDDPYGGGVHLAPRGTPLWKTRRDNFAPRVGASYLVSQKEGSHVILRGGFGYFYDLSFGEVASAYRSYPFSVLRIQRSVAFPLTPEVLAPPVLGVDPPASLWVMDRNVVLPLTYQWNVSAERALGSYQTVTVGYVGAGARKLLNLDQYRIRLLEWPASTRLVNVNRNRSYSDYDALQVQFQRRLHAGLQSIVSYTLGRSRDTASDANTIAVPTEVLPASLDYGYSNFDVRHVFNAAVTYQVAPAAGRERWRRALQYWGVDVLFRARSGFPIRVQAQVPFDVGNQLVRPNVVPGQPFWLDDPSAPGGRRLNRAAFVAPTSNTQGNLVRGAVRGFPLRQIDLAIRRDFRLPQNLRLQAKVEAFNLLNTPHFSDPGGRISIPGFEVSSQMLASGFGGQNAVYQIGGPRSIQLGLKLLF